MPGRKSFLIVTLLSLVTTVRLSADCPSTVTVLAPPSACKSGTATVAVTGVPGATYAWTVDGATIAGDATSDRVNLTFGAKAAATVSVTMTAGGCVSHGNSVIALHDAFNVQVAAVHDAHASEPLTLSWNYTDGSPARQTITGSDFGTITLAPGVRSYTYWPDKSGTKQFVIDAALAAPAGSAPLPSRQRAVATSPAFASSCTLVHAAVPYSVSDCVAPPVLIDVPESVVKGTTFHATVRSQPGALALWTITNGSPETATGDDVTITAGTTGNVAVSVQLTRGACGDQSARSIPILAEAACDHPTVVVSAGAVSCGSAVVNATFTGTPPFKGLWSDNVPFTTSLKSFTRTVKQAGTYSITSFEDLWCAGTASGAAEVPVPGPTVSFTSSGNSCVGTDTITATFTGKPPFTGFWQDDARTPLQTNEMSVTRPIFAYCSTGGGNIFSGHDGTGCSITVVGSQPIVHIPNKLRVGTDCPVGNTTSVWANFDVGAWCYASNSLPEGPWTAVWSDGVTTSSNDTNSRQNRRSGPTGTIFTVVSAHNAFCAAEIVNASPPASTDVAPDFTLPDGVCVGQTQTVSLTTTPPLGAVVTWSVNNGSIVSGQGTSTMQYLPTFVGPANISCAFSYPIPNHCPLSLQRSVLVGPIEPFTTLTVSPTETAYGGGEPIDLAFTTNIGLVSWSWSNSLNDSITPVGNCTPPFTQSGVCHARYTSLHGAGVSTITLHVNGFCRSKDITVKLTLNPP